MQKPAITIVDDYLLSAVRVSKHFGVIRSLQTHRLAALRDVSFELKAGETVGIVGESGSGKTTLAKLLAGHDRPDTGRVLYNGSDIHSMNRRTWFAMRRSVQMVFQNHAGALDPRQTVVACLTEAINSGKKMSRQAVGLRIQELLSAVALSEELLQRYPEELSSGQRQRVTIARALAVEPTVLIADEPTANLDARLRRRIIDLLSELQRTFGLSLILISHDISLISESVQRVLVLYHGRVVESGSTGQVLGNTSHPYTRMLLAAARDITVSDTGPGTADSVGTPAPDGCVFADRCPEAQAICFEKQPEMHVSGDHHKVACINREELCGSIL